MLPNFLVLGAPRTGTTWLHAVLSHHPQVHLPDLKEPDFLNRRILSEDFREYTRLFDPRPGTPAKPLRGDMSVNYSNLVSPVVRQVAALLPGAKLVFTLRHPVDRLWSMLKFTYGTFAGRVLRRPPVVRFLRACHNPRFTRRNDYLEVMHRWSAAFGRESLHVDLFDRIEVDPDRYVRDVLAHLGADAPWQPPAELLNVRIHATDDVEIPPVFRWYLSTEWLEPTRRLNDELNGTVSHWVDSLRAAAAEATPSRRILRQLNRTILSLPDRLAYAAYDARRNRALERRIRAVLPAARAAELMALPGDLDVNVDRRPRRLQVAATDAASAVLVAPSA